MNTVVNNIQLNEIYYHLIVDYQMRIIIINFVLGNEEMFTRMLSTQVSTWLPNRILANLY
ncbi:hypothetical protein VCRA2116O30_90043 [Vibrio crassostreae]|uniref:Uncharacterized protein n=1 Tax=Vibrio crassostreae TaxID=246167 RepID=A0ABM9QNP6_9VIBR|nr:hypothetical protein VCRA2117O37_100034 [Vibrio crassostreae]CAK1696238.1 hypothetical protein VCRA2116O31_100043 [Vibrio crassostreae]CAK2221718.1 hypothetical protein VCRA2119O47_70043 [Vibrio crassostreae]CAK2223496.1 hypothetical protein VCRA2118O41_70035 [Vibrio crassostreae]CAK2239076.1 hypothetical protein VCRA2119O46_70203 [Vibrio crassostreae]